MIEIASACAAEQSKVSENKFSGLSISISGFLLKRKITQKAKTGVNTNCSLPFALSFIPSNTLKLTRTIWSFASISLILNRSCWPKIFTLVVKPVSVFVVYLWHLFTKNFLVHIYRPYFCRRNSDTAPRVPIRPVFKFTLVCPPTKAVQALIVCIVYKCHFALS